MKFEETKPIYLQIIDLIFELILQKKWKEDERIPSIRDLASQLEVNPNTVAKAYSECEVLGIISNQRGKGYFLNSNAYSLTLEHRKMEFIKYNIPKILKELKMLNISFDEFLKYIENGGKNEE